MALDQLGNMSSDSSEQLWDYIVVGAGIAGSSCAKLLRDAGYSVAIVDKARGSGGRLSSKRLDVAGIEYSYDLGAQSFLVQSKDFVSHLTSSDASAFMKNPQGKEEAYGAARNSLLARSNLGGVDAIFGSRVLGITESVADSSGADTDMRIWQVRLQKGDQEFFLQSRNVVLASPPIQSAEILGNEHYLSEALLDVRHHPQWVAMIALPRRADWAKLVEHFQAEQLGHDVLQGVYIDNTKPSRKIEGDCDVYVLHASLLWSVAHQEVEKQDALKHLLSALAEVLGLSTEELLQQALATHIHRWLYSRVDDKARFPSPYIYGEDGLHFCGDYFTQSGQYDDLESAFLSAYRLCHDCLLQDLKQKGSKV